MSEKSWWVCVSKRKNGSYHVFRSSKRGIKADWKSGDYTEQDAVNLVSVLRKLTEDEKKQFVESNLITVGYQRRPEDGN